MKDQILKIAKVKNEAEFYRKYPSEEAFMKAHGKAFKKAAMGTQMVAQQLDQLTDWDGAPKAANGSALNFQDLLNGANATNAGVSLEDLKKQDTINKLKSNGAPATDYAGMGKGIGNIIDIFGKSKDTTVAKPSAANSYAGLGVDDTLPDMKNGGHKLKKGQMGLTDIGNMIKGGFDKKGGLGSGLVDMFGGDSKSIMNVGANGALGAGGAGFTAGAEAAGLGLLNAAPQILQGFDQVQQQRGQIAQAQEKADIAHLTDLSANAQNVGIQKHRINRPEDQGIINSAHPYGQAKYGTHIGGNLTEIQNTYAPGNMYQDLGYEPLNDSVKQYAYGGGIPKASFGLSSFTQSSGQASIGKGAGTAIGSAFFGPIGGFVGGELGGAIGHAFFGGEDDANKLDSLNKQTTASTESAAWGKGANALHAQNAANMKEGGWMNPNYNPQLITKFGNMDVTDVHNFAHQGMDSLRAGGHLKEYTAPSAHSMYTGRDVFANGGDLIHPDNTYLSLGGQLETTWGGIAEPISYNPFLPGTGETVMFKGQFHNETNGKGQSGIGVKYGDGGMTDYAKYGASDSDAHVEVENNEPGFESIDPVTGEKVFNVAGNMYIPKYGAEHIGDKKASGKKFKNYVAELSEKEAKLNKAMAKSKNYTDDSLDTRQAYEIGIPMQLKEIADKKKAAMNVQNAILDTAKEMNVESASLAKGKLSPIKDPTIGKNGKKLKKAQSGTPMLSAANPTGYTVPELGAKINIPYEFPYPLPADPIDTTGGFPPFSDAKNAPWTELTLPNYKQPRSLDYVPYKPGFAQPIPLNLPNSSAPTSIDPIVAARQLSNIEALKPTKTKGKGVDLKTALLAAESMYPYFRPTNQFQLSPEETMGEMYALGNNQLEPVQSQSYQPRFKTAYNISLQDQLNEVDAQARAALRQLGSNQTAASQIMANAAEQKNKIRGEQLRMNTANQIGTSNDNLATSNDAQLKNIAMNDTQYQRQSEAKSKTKAQTIAALQSIGDKLTKSKQENMMLAIDQNRYNYRFGPNGQAYSINNPYQFDINSTTAGATNINNVTGNTATLAQLQKAIADGKAAEALVKNGGKTVKNGASIKARNGSIVNATKTLKPL